MRIALNTTYDSGCATILESLGTKFQAAGHEVVRNDWEHYPDYDLILFLGNDSQVTEAKQTGTKALIGILCPYLHNERWCQEARMADFLLADSIEMRDIFLQYNKDIFIYYMFPDIRAVQKTHEQKSKVVIGYHGNKTHLSCMDKVSVALDMLAQGQDIEFWAMYNIAKLGRWTRNLPKLCRVRHVQWSDENYYRELAQCDIGVVPAALPVNGLANWTTRVQSSFVNNWPHYYKTDYMLRFKHPTNPGRVYVFSQLGIPVVADFVPSFCQVIQDGHSGYLALSAEGWYTALKRLAQSAELRATMSRNLKGFIDKTCSPDGNFQEFLKFLELQRKNHG